MVAFGNEMMGEVEEARKALGPLKCYRKALANIDQLRRLARGLDVIDLKEV